MNVGINSVHGYFIGAATLVCCSIFGTPSSLTAEELPFQHSVEVYRHDGEEMVAFALRLEQPFLAEEFEKSNYLRLRAVDSNAFLIYPKETRFQQKHAEFFGRLKGQGPVQVSLSYETVTENLDGSRRVDVREGTISIDIPAIESGKKSVGPESVFKDWANQQNQYFLRLLKHYPNESFFQYCLLQSESRYGVTPPPLPQKSPTEARLEDGLYKLFSGSLAMQESLQRRALSSTRQQGDFNRQVSSLTPPKIQSLDYEALLDKYLKEDPTAVVAVHPVSKLVPSDQYLLHFNSFETFGEALDLAASWGDDIFRLGTLTAQDNRIQEKLEEQLLIRRNGMERLFAQGAVQEMAITGSDPYLLDGTDVTLIVKISDEQDSDKQDTDEQDFSEQTQNWLIDAREQHPNLVERTFNYRGHQITARYTNDRLVSSFTTRHDAWQIYSNSHRAIRRVIDAAMGEIDALHDEADYRYLSTLHPASQDADSGYYYASDAFIRRVVGPIAKISQKRRVECFNNLVMQNNASLFFRLEYGRSPESLSEMIEKRFIAAEKIICPHGGSYSFDSEDDTCTCSLHNRLRYLTPNAELSVLKVSSEEAAEYERYKNRYRSFWQKLFVPVSMKIGVGPTIKLETCMLPMPGTPWDDQLRESLSRNPLEMKTASIAPSAITSFVMVPGRENTSKYLMSIPGIKEIVQQDPTLVDLSWCADRVGIHYCDGEMIFEIDPTALRPVQIPFVGQSPASVQASVGALALSTNLPVYATIDIENRGKAQRLLDQLSEQAFLKQGKLGPFAINGDAYRLPDYRNHPIYVFSIRLHAVTLRLHTALVGDQLVMATKPDVLHEVIDASAAVDDGDTPLAHLMFRLNRNALNHLQDDVQLHWAEKSRLACHRNIISIHNLHQLYEVPMDEIAKLSEAKYGIRYFCPECGEYSYDSEASQIVCSVHGNRESSRQNSVLNPNSTTAQLIEEISQILAYLRYDKDAIFATIEIDRQDAHAIAADRHEVD